MLIRCLSDADLPTFGAMVTLAISFAATGSFCVLMRFSSCPWHFSSFVDVFYSNASSEASAQVARTRQSDCPALLYLLVRRVGVELTICQTQTETNPYQEQPGFALCVEDYCAPADLLKAITSL